MRIRPSETASIISQYSNSKNSEAMSNTQNTRASADAKRPQKKNNYESVAVRADISKDYDTYNKAVKEIKTQETESRNMKIQNLKKQIEDGTYEIKPKEIAQSIMAKTNTLG
jgi:anti-sigma28 factor (negative regulator of flagellin synthesis)